VIFQNLTSVSVTRILTLHIQHNLKRNTHTHTHNVRWERFVPLDLVRTVYRFR